jgi:hypothetical protein
VEYEREGFPGSGWPLSFTAPYRIIVAAPTPGLQAQDLSVEVTADNRRFSAEGSVREVQTALAVLVSVD